MNASDAFNPSQSYSPGPTQTQRGCFFYGCLSLVIIGVLGLVGLGTLAVLTSRYAARQLLQIAEDTKQTFPKVELTPDARKSLNERVKTFGEAIEANKPTEPLVLTSDELNTLIAENLEGLRDYLRLEIVGDRLEGNLSIPADPLDFFGWFGLKGKFINIKGLFDVSLENGVLLVVLREGQVKGQSIPPSVLEQFRQENLAGEAYKNPENARVLGKLESITLKDGKVIIKARVVPDASAGDDKPVEPAPEKSAEPKPEPEPKVEPTKKAEKG